MDTLDTTIQQYAHCALCLFCFLFLPFFSISFFLPFFLIIQNIQMSPYINIDICSRNHFLKLISGPQKLYVTTEKIYIFVAMLKTLENDILHLSKTKDEANLRNRSFTFSFMNQYFA